MKRILVILFLAFSLVLVPATPVEALRCTVTPLTPKHVAGSPYITIQASVNCPPYPYSSKLYVEAHNDSNGTVPAWKEGNFTNYGTVGFAIGCNAGYYSTYGAVHNGIFYNYPSWSNTVYITCN